MPREETTGETFGELPTVSASVALPPVRIAATRGGASRPDNGGSRHAVPAPLYGTLAAFVAADEQPILAAHRDPPQSEFRFVVVDRQAAVAALSTLPVS